MEKNITILAFGAGQDSTAILYRIVRDKMFWDQYVKGRLIVLMSDTGNEHPATYAHVQFIKCFCESHNIEFYLITSNLGYHPKNWDSLQANFKAHSTVMSVAFPKTCTDNLKIKPLYNFLDHYTLLDTITAMKRRNVRKGSGTSNISANNMAKSTSS